MDGKTYLNNRGVTDEEISSWHITWTNEYVSIPVFNMMGIYMFPIKRYFSEGSEKTYDYLENAPVHYTLFGIEKVRQSIHEKGFGIVSEGPFDIISLHRVGITNSVALMANTMSRWQVAMLMRLTKRVVLFLDNDKAGREGSDRSKGILQKYGMSVSICFPTMHKDADEQVRFGPNVETLERVLQNAEVVL